MFIKYFLDLWLVSDSIYLWKRTADFFNEMNVPAFSFPGATAFEVPSTEGMVEASSKKEKNCCRKLCYFHEVYKMNRVLEDFCENEYKTNFPMGLALIF